MFDRGSWNTLLSHLASGAGCEIFGERKNKAGQNSGCGISGEDGTSQEGPSVCAWCKDPSPWWYRARIAIRSNSIRIPQEDTWCAPLSGLPQGEAHDTRDHHTPDDSISYPDMLSGSLSHTPWILDLLMAKEFKASVLHVSELSIALPWIPKNSPQFQISLVIKKLSKHQNLTQFDYNWLQGSLIC